jgi:uncharacterized membrane protein YjgN (DUF898 family)
MTIDAPLFASTPRIAPISPAAPAGDGQEELHLSWVPPPGMVALSFKNFFYRIVTLGIYHFWGKTEVRKRIWSATRINGEPLQYTGTGKEMFQGFLLVLTVLTIPALLVTLAGFVAFGARGADAMQGILTIAFFFLIGVGMHRAVRYRMSRTQWRGIRGGLEGSSWRYGWTYFWTGIVLVLTLGWASPWRAVKLQGLVTNGLRFGDRPFRFAASAGPLYGPFLVLWLSSVAILGIIGAVFYLGFRDMGLLQGVTPGQPANVSILIKVVLLVYGAFFVGFLMFAAVSAWYRARMMNHFAAHTTFEGVSFSATATGPSLVWLSVTNMLIVIFTLGLLAPVAQARAARYFVERLQMTGSAPLGEILQGAAHEGRGEGLAQAFDIDAF